MKQDEKQLLSKKSEFELGESGTSSVFKNNKKIEASLKKIKHELL